MSSPANLDVIAASSFGYGDITTLVRQSYLKYTVANPADTSNKWKVNIPAPRDKGFISWRVRYPVGDSIPATDFGWSSVQTTLCDYSAGGTSNATVIDYEPMKLLTVPQSASPPIFIAAFSWGSSDRTSAVRSLLTANSNQATFTFNLSQLGAPPPGSGPTTPTYMVYGYVVPNTKVSPPTNTLLLCSYFGIQQAPSISIKMLAPPNLNVLGAYYGTLDVSDILASFVDDQQNLTLDLAKLSTYFGISMKPGNNVPVTVLSILYRYDGQDMRCWASTATTGSLTLSPDVQISSTPNLCRRPRSGESNVLALVWGDGTAQSQASPQWPLAEVYNDKIFTSMTFVPSSAYFDGLSPGAASTCHIYYQYGVTGDIQCASSAANGQIVLNPRNIQSFDPPPAQGLLRPDDPSPCFTLRTYSEMPVGVQSMPSNSTWQLTSGSGQTPATFMVVRTNTVSDGNAPFAMLKIYITSLQKWAYLGIPTQSSWPNLAGQPASFMVPGQGCSNNPADWALALNYEIPSRNDEAGIMLCASQYRAQTQAGYNPNFFILHQHGSTPVIMLMSLQSALHYLPGTTFGPKFLANPQVVSLNPDVMEASEETVDFTDSCLVQDLCFLKVFGWDLLCTVCGLFSLTNPFDWAAKLSKWWTKGISSHTRALLMSGMAIIQNMVHTAAANSQGLGASQTTFAGLKVITDMYNGDCLWSLAKNLLTNFSWWDLGKLVLNIVAIAIEILQPEFWVTKAIAIASWLVSAYETLVGWVKACGASSIAYMSALRSRISIASQTAKLLALSPVNQHKAMLALTTPVVYRLSAHDPVLQAPHPLIAHVVALKSDAGPQQEQIEHPFVGLFNDLDPDTQAVAVELAPMFEDMSE